MSNSQFNNQTHTVVKLSFRTPGVENMTIFQGDSNRISGLEGYEFVYAWKTRDELISESEMAQYGAIGTYGQNYTFGNPAGRVP